MTREQAIERAVRNALQDDDELRRVAYMITAGVTNGEGFTPRKIRDIRAEFARLMS